MILKIFSWLFKDFAYKLYDLAEERFTLQIDNDTITPYPPCGQVGVPYSEPFTATPDPITAQSRFTLVDFIGLPVGTFTPSLPPGTSFPVLPTPYVEGASTMSLSGTPTTVGVFAFTPHADRIDPPRINWERNFAIGIKGSVPSINTCVSDICLSSGDGNAIPYGFNKTIQFFLSGTPITNSFDPASDAGTLQGQINANIIVGGVTINVVGLVVFDDPPDVFSTALFTITKPCDVLPNVTQASTTVIQEGEDPVITTENLTCDCPPTKRKKSALGAPPMICINPQINPLTRERLPCPRTISQNGYLYERVGYNPQGQCCYLRRGLKFKSQ